MERLSEAIRDRADTALVATGSLLTAGLVGAALAAQVPVGLALLIGVVYLPLVFTNLAIAVCVWIPLVFLEGLPAFNLAGKAAGMLLALGWIGALMSGEASQVVLVRHRRLFELTGLLVAWLTISIAWAPSSAQAAGGAWRWWAVALVLLIVATAITTEKTLTLAVSAYVVGALVGLVQSALSGGVAAEDNRLASSVGNPNELAAVLVSAIPLALALSVVRPTPGVRLACWAAVVGLTVGIVPTQSRGGLLAGLAMWLAALVVLPSRRHVVAVGGLVLATIAIAFALSPAAWERVTIDDPRGTGRVDIWTVAWSMFRDRPITGVGITNFGQVAPEYVRDVGPLERVDLVVGAPDREVHNSFLELLAENGVPALVMFLAVAVGCMRTALQAAKEFAAQGRRDLMALSHGLFVATAGLLASYFFSSPPVDRRLWILSGLSLAALAVARRERTPGPESQVHA